MGNSEKNLCSQNQEKVIGRFRYCLLMWNDIIHSGNPNKNPCTLVIRKYVAENKKCREIIALLYIPTIFWICMFIISNVCLWGQNSLLKMNVINIMTTWASWHLFTVQTEHISIIGGKNGKSTSGFGHFNSREISC